MLIIHKLNKQFFSLLFTVFICNFEWKMLQFKNKSFQNLKRQALPKMQLKFKIVFIIKKFLKTFILLLLIQQVYDLSSLICSLYLRIQYIIYDFFFFKLGRSYGVKTSVIIKTENNLFKVFRFLLLLLYKSYNNLKPNHINLI